MEYLVIVFVIGQLMFFDHGRNYMAEQLLPALRAAGADVLPPVSLDDCEPGPPSDGGERKMDEAERWKAFNLKIDAAVRTGTDRADVLVAVLDGNEPNARTLVEIAYAAENGKLVLGFWGDVRRDPYCELCPMNPQAERLIAQSGGAIHQVLSDLTQALARERKDRRLQAAVSKAATWPVASPNSDRPS